MSSIEVKKKAMRGALTEKLQAYSVEQLIDVAKSERIRLHSKNKESIIGTIARTAVTRHFRK